MDETTEALPPRCTEESAPHPVARHYTRSALLSSVLDALAAAGRPVSPMDSDDVAPMDEMHSGGRAATVALVELLAPSAGDRVLDLGCGLGGVSRYLARHRDCRVTGVDLTRESVEVATELTQRCGLAERAEFRRADVTALPLDGAGFDAAVLVHVGMNVADKAALCAEAYRVLRPGGTLAVYDVMLRSPTDELTYPVPWASSPEISFLEPAQEYHRLLTNAGFSVEREVDLSELVRGQFARLRALPDDQLPPVGLQVVIGEGFRAKVTNLADGVDRGVVAPVQLLATR